MSARDYVFRHTTEVAAPPAAVHGVLVDLESYGSWWPQVVAVASLGPEDALVICRSRLPYDLELHLHAESREPHVLRVAIDGPITGTAQWLLRAVPGGTRLEFEQQVRAVDAMLVVASHLVKPVLRWNHHTMMQGAERGLVARFGRL